MDQMVHYISRLSKILGGTTLVLHFFLRTILWKWAIKDFESISGPPQKGRVWVNWLQEAFISKVNPQSLVSNTVTMEGCSSYLIIKLSKEKTQ